jgi:uncharacterized membrane protein YjjP (DUF1212 family)
VFFFFNSDLYTCMCIRMLRPFFHSCPMVTLFVLFSTFSFLKILLSIWILFLVSFVSSLCVFLVSPELNKKFLLPCFNHQFSPVWCSLDMFIFNCLRYLLHCLGFFLVSSFCMWWLGTFLLERLCSYWPNN